MSKKFDVIYVNVPTIALAQDFLGVYSDFKDSIPLESNFRVVYLVENKGTPESKHFDQNTPEMKTGLTFKSLRKAKKFLSRLVQNLNKATRRVKAQDSLLVTKLIDAGKVKLSSIAYFQEGKRTQMSEHLVQNALSVEDLKSDM